MLTYWSDPPDMNRVCLACGAESAAPACPGCGARAVPPSLRFGLGPLDAAAESPPPDGLDPSRRFGRFTLAEVLGRGASGVVHRAWDPRLHRFVALKILDSDQRPALAPAFWHPQLARIHAAGPGWLARDYATGPTLRDGAPALPLDRRLELFRTVCGIVREVHGWGLAPVDTQPGGIFLTSGGPFIVDYANGDRGRGPERRLGELLYYLLELRPPARRPARPKHALGELCLRALNSKATLGELLTPGTG